MAADKERHIAFRCEYCGTEHKIVIQLKPNEPPKWNFPESLRVYSLDEQPETFQNETT